MINILKAFISVILIVFTFSNTLLADCGHCYRTAEVKIILKDGESKKVIIPIYGRDITEKSPMIKSDIDIKPLYEEEIKSITYVDSIHSIPKIGRLAVKEKIKKLPLDTIDQIVFLSWDNMTGAGEITNLPQEQITSLKSREILADTTIEGSLAVLTYVNQDPNISEKEFKLFFRYVPHSAPNKYREIESKIKEKLISIEYTAKNNDSLQNAKNLIIEFRNSLKKDIEDISIDFLNEDIENYFKYVSKQKEKKVEFLNIIISYLENGNSKVVESFVDNNIDDEKTKKTAIEIINDPQDFSSQKKDNIETRARISLISMKALDRPLSWKNYDLYKKTLEKTGFIEIMFAWD